MWVGYIHLYVILIYRRANDSHLHAGGTARSTSVENNQKAPHESLWEKKRSVSSGKITHVGKGDADERNGLGKLSKVPVPGSAVDRTIPPKKAGVSRSDITTNNFKQCGDELPIGKHSRSVSSSGLPKLGGDGFIEVDKRSSNGSGLDKSVSSDTQVKINIIRPNVQMYEATATTDSSLHVGISRSTYSDMYSNNASVEVLSGSKKSSEENVRTRSMHGLDKSFIRDANEDESLVKHYAVSSDLPSDHEHCAVLRAPELVTGNNIALNSDRSDNAKVDSYLNSLQDVNSQVVNGLRRASVKYSQVDASDVGPHERSDSATVMQSQKSFGNMNSVLEANMIPEINFFRNVDGERTHMNSNGHLSNGFKSKNEVAHMGAKRKASTSKIDMAKRSTYLSASNSPCSSDDEIDKHSEASASAAAVKKAIKEAQALINVAKESNGVKGFMSLAMAKKSGQVKVAKEEHNSTVNENPKFFEAAQAKIQNHFSTSAVDTAPGFTGSETRITSAGIVIGRSKPEGIEFSTVDKPIQMKAVEMQSLRNKTLESATTKHAPPTIKSFQEKLAVYGSTMDQKLTPGNEDVTLPDIVAGSEKISIFSETYSFKVPNVEKRDAEVYSATQEAFLNNRPESPRKENVAFPGLLAGSGQIRIIPEAYHSIVPIVEKSEAEVNSAREEAFLNNSPESDTGDEKESQKAMDSSNQGSMMQTFHDDFVKTGTGCSVDSFEVKRDAVVATQHIHTHWNETIMVESEGHASSDLTSLVEENVEESEVEPHDQELDCEDTDSQDYASAEENWVPTDTDEEINENDHHFSAENNLDEINEVEHMLSPEVTVISEDIMPPSLKNLLEDQIVEETDDVPLLNILTKEAQVSDEKTSPVVHNSDDPVVEEIDKSEGMSLPNMATHDAEVTSEEVTTPILNEDLIVEEAIGSENGALHNMLIPEVKLTSGETTVPFFNYSDEDPIAEEAEIGENASVMFIVSPRTKITSEDGASSCSNCANGDTGVEIGGTLDMNERTMVTHEDVTIPENDIAPFYDKSNVDQIVEDSVDDTLRESSVSLLNNEYEEGITGAAMLHEQTNSCTEKLDSLVRVETESAFCTDLESSNHEGSEVEPISTDDLSEESAADVIEESISTPWTFEPPNQEIDDINFCNPDTIVQQDQEELPNDAGVEANVIDECLQTVNVKGFQNDNAAADAGKEDATETESTSWNPEHVNSEPEPEVQNFEPFPDSDNETTEVEQLSEDFSLKVERHERRKWDISREAFELPELEIGAPDIQHSMKQDDTERQMDKHERKKWEIPRENFELLVLGDEVVKDNEENVGHDTEGATQAAEKPERKKWKIQKEVFEVPILCAEAVQDPPDHEGFVIKTPSAEEMEMTHNLSNAVTFPEEMVQHEEVHYEFSGNADAIPGEAASCELRCENSEEEIAKESVCENRMSSEEEPCKQLGETSNEQDSKICEGKTVEQEDCMKRTEDINVKEEIKRTLGMLWKKIYNIKQDEASKPAELAGKENVNANDTTGQGITKDLNLNGPVQLVESPRQLDDTETLIFSGNRKGKEDSSESPLYTEPFKVNETSICKSREFISIETREVQRNSPLAFDSCKYQEGASEENENFNANLPESQSEESLSGSESESCTEMASIHEACDLKKEGTPNCNIPPPNVYEQRQMDSETVGSLKHLVVDESLVDNAESTQKAEVLQQDGLNEVQEDISDENLSEVEGEMHHVDDLSDKRCTDSEQHNTNAGRQDLDSVSDSDIPDVTHGFEQRINKNERCPDKIEQASSWKWIFGDEIRDKSDEQDESADVKNLREVKGKTKETTNDNDVGHVSRKMKSEVDKPTFMGNTVPNHMHKEVTPEQDVLKNLMRAKELERIAVERAIREARERAFIEARERAVMERANAVARETSAKEKANSESRERIALERPNAQVRERAATERANADAQQKVNSKGQERSQSLSSDAKIASEKNSLEAKRKAELERAAVERATIEARQRALEKAMSKKVSFWTFVFKSELILQSIS